KQMTYDDMIEIGKLPHVVASSASLQYTDYNFNEGSATAHYGLRKSENVALEGDTVSEMQVYDKALQAGRLFTRTDQARHADVTVLGHDISPEFVGTPDPLGK